MARMTNDARLARIHAEALSQFDAIQEAVRDERMQCLEDRRFYSIAGAQWEGTLGEQFEHKPKFEVNKIHLAVIRIFNEYRNNRITVDFVPKDGTPDSKLADTCDGLYRADEQDSVAEEAYDNAFEEAVGGGFGAWRIRAVYEDDEDAENERQRIRIEPIYDADSCVFFDLNSKRQDKSDATHCFVLTSQTVPSYLDEWDDDPASWPKEIQSTVFDWRTPDVVYVAEYYRIVSGKDDLITFEDITGGTQTYYRSELDEEDDILENLLAAGNKEIKRRKVKTKKVHKYIMSGSKILEDCGIIAGKCIPIVPVYGKRWFVDGIERCMGHVRLAKDAQRLKNMQLSKLGELSALSSTEKPIFTPEQMSGNQVMWQDDNIKNYPYLLVNSITDQNGNALPSGPIGYTKPPQVPPAMAALLQITEQDMADILGSSQQADKMVSNISGKAVELIQTRLDMQTFIYMSNMAKAMRRGGEIWLGMAKDLYPGDDDDRKMKIIGPQSEIGSVELKRPITDKETGELIFENDLSDAAMDVAVSVGPSSVSRRETTVRNLTNMMGMTQDPETSQVLQSMAMMNMEGEGIQDVRDFFRKRLVKLGALKPNDEEAEEMAQMMANVQPDPNTVYLEAAAANEMAKAKKAQADSIKSLADAAKTRAETLDTMANMDINEQKHALDIAQQMDDALSGNQPTAQMAATEGTEV